MQKKSCSTPKIRCCCFVLEGLLPLREVAGAHGLRAYARHYIEPNPILLPFHIVSEISRTIALAVRLFGNIFSLEMAALLILLVAGFLVPVPVLLLHIVEALVQAYIFGMLALIYIGGGIQSLEMKKKEQ